VALEATGGVVERSLEQDLGAGLTRQEALLFFVPMARSKARIQ